MRVGTIRKSDMNSRISVIESEIEMRERRKEEK